MSTRQSAACASLERQLGFVAPGLQEVGHLEPGAELGHRLVDGEERVLRPLCLDALGHPLGDRISRTRVGYLPEDRGLYRDVKIIDTLTYFGALRGIPQKEARARAMDLLISMGLGDAAEKKAAELSRGMHQKAQLIATILNDPDLLIIDEPFQGTNSQEGRGILASSGLDITPAETLQEAAEKAVAAARDDYRSALVGTADQLRGLLLSQGDGSDAGLDRAAAELGNFAAGRIDVDDALDIARQGRRIARGVDDEIGRAHV